ncbi:hypothetical protein [Halapricum salinum]|uniref:Uncharacterized protein n=1 Tax=Halapricum salinum TaxID=1457250 RepID=A0A4D6HBR6_9EURY|nr:hypothetical protein [Halapricum salinum]QCC51065.1 hypothetical protein DV733_07320 [Halapricum salinum]
MNRNGILAGVVLAALAGGGTYALGANLLTVGALAFVAVIAGVLTVEFRHQLPGRGTSSRASWWNSGWTATTILAVFFGVNTTLPLALDTRLALQLLVLGVGWNGLMFGLAIADAQS